jgi:hypothetical protein
VPASFFLDAEDWCIIRTVSTSHWEVINSWLYVPYYDEADTDGSPPYRLPPLQLKSKAEAHGSTSYSPDANGLTPDTKPQLCAAQTQTDIFAIAETPSPEQTGRQLQPLSKDDELVASYQVALIAQDIQRVASLQAKLPAGSQQRFNVITSILTQVAADADLTQREKLCKIERLWPPREAEFQQIYAKFFSEIGSRDGQYTEQPEDEPSRAGQADGCCLDIPAEHKRKKHAKNIRRRDALRRRCAQQVCRHCYEHDALREKKASTPVCQQPQLAGELECRQDQCVHSAPPSRCTFRATAVACLLAPFVIFSRFEHFAIPVVLPLTISYADSAALHHHLGSSNGLLAYTAYRDGVLEVGRHMVKFQSKVQMCNYNASDTRYLKSEALFTTFTGILGLRPTSLFSTAQERRRLRLLQDLWPPLDPCLRAILLGPCSSACDEQEPSDPEQLADRSDTAAREENPSSGSGLVRLTRRERAGRLPNESEVSHPNVSHPYERHRSS